MAKNNEAAVIEGTLTVTARIGERTQKGLIRKRNAYTLDMGMVALEGDLFGKLPGEKYKVTLTPIQ
jgi:hypothetical protein